MEPTIFDDLHQCLTEAGPDAAIERLCAVLRDRKDYTALFYALLLKKRHELGVSPVPTGPSQDLPEEVHGPYEDAIRAAARLVGQLYLDEGNIPHAWIYFRMIGDPEPVARALEQVQPAEGEDIQPVIEIAYHHGVNPRKGFDLILERYGICNAITTVTSQEMSLPGDVREYCLTRLVRALYHELLERLKGEIVRREGAAPDPATIGDLMAGRDWLFEDDFYHIDISHLGAVVQMSMYLPAGEELNMARQLCGYGTRLSPRFQQPGDSPFQDMYRDYAVYLAILAGENVEQNLDHFRAKIETADPETDGTRPAEVLVNLLLRLDRPAEALAVGRRHLTKVENRSLLCPGITELCQRAHDYGALTEVGRELADPVHFMAGLLGSTKACQAKK
jgi:hypothetical protein